MVKVLIIMEEGQEPEWVDIVDIEEFLPLFEPDEGKNKEEEPEAEVEESEAEAEVEESEEESYTADDIREMNKKASKAFIKENDLGIEIKGLDAEELQDAIIEALGLGEEEEVSDEGSDENWDDNEEEEEERPKKKKKKKKK